jgi:geranylgeranyl diphosphate synthase type II
MLSQIGNYQKWIEQAIKKEKFGNKPASLYEPMRYLMGLSGKRIRPMLTLLAYALYHDNVKSAVPYAVVLESFHNFTLMHDDIMDNAPLRRGNVTVHEKWNTSTAILSGDAMLIKVYNMFLTLDADRLKTVLASFNKCALEVCEGQQWDMEFETSDNVTEPQYLNMIRLKTAVLLGFSLELGAVLANASEQDRNAMREFGTNIGIGFQLKDDLLDAFADPKKFGKQVGGDIIANKKTYLLIKALEKADKKTKQELQHWLTIKKFKKQAKVNAVKEIYNELKIAALTERKINHYFTKGFQCLESVNGFEEQKKMLKEYTQALIERQS